MFHKQIVVVNEVMTKSRLHYKITLSNFTIHLTLTLLQWDIRTYHLLHTIPALDHCQLYFTHDAGVIYGKCSYVYRLNHIMTVFLVYCDCIVKKSKLNAPL